MSKKSLKDLLPETLGNQEDASGSSNLQELKDQVEQLVSQEFPKRLTALSELYKRRDSVTWKLKTKDGLPR